MASCHAESTTVAIAVKQTTRIVINHHVVDTRGWNRRCQRTQAPFHWSRGIGRGGQKEALRIIDEIQRAEESSGGRKWHSPALRCTSVSVKLNTNKAGCCTTTNFFKSRSCFLSIFVVPQRRIVAFNEPLIFVGKAKMLCNRHHLVSPFPSVRSSTCILYITIPVLEC